LVFFVSEFDNKVRTFSPIEAQGSIKLISQDNDKPETKTVIISPIQIFRYPYAVLFATC